MALVIILGIAVVLFILAFLTKRRFGVLGLGLAAGVVLSQLWAVTLVDRPGEPECARFAAVVLNCWSGSDYTDSAASAHDRWPEVS